MTDVAAAALKQLHNSGLIAPGVVLRPASTIRPEPVEWTWEGRLPRGALSLIVGIQGQGKTLLSTELAARLSRGQLEGHYFGIPVNSILASAEDSPAHTLVPRLMAAGADLERISFVSMQREYGESGLLLPEDVGALQRAAEEQDARAIFIDPLMAHLGPNINSHRDQDIRRALAPVARAADESVASWIAIAHLNKSATSDIFQKVGGSMGITAAPRSVLFMAPRPGEAEGSAERVLVHAKCNVAAHAVTLKFRVEGREIETDDNRHFDTAGLAWCGEDATIGSRDILSSPTEEEHGAIGEAVEVLRDMLEEGPLSAKDATRRARDAGISERTLRRARKSLGIKPRKEGSPGTNEQRWTWELPDDFSHEGGQEEPKVAKVANETVLDTSGPPSKTANEVAITESWPSRPPSVESGHLRERTDSDPLDGQTIEPLAAQLKAISEWNAAIPPTPIDDIPWDRQRRHYGNQR